MIAFQDIKAEMRHAIRAVTAPDSGRQAPPAQVTRNGQRPAAESLIDPWMEAAFTGLIHAGQTGEPYDLIPCSMNGKPAVVIGLAQQIGTRIHVMPLFLACQPWMEFGGPVSEGEEGGGPARTDEDAPAPS